MAGAIDCKFDRSLTDKPHLRVEMTMRRMGISIRGQSCPHLRIRTLRLSSWPPSPSPIAPSAQLRSSFAQQRRGSAYLGSENLWIASSRLQLFCILPNGLFGRLRSVTELTQRAFWCPFHMPCRKLRVQRRCRAVPSLNDSAPSSTTGRLPLNWTLSSPSHS